jgi:RHS repeat-associated protein
VTEQRFDYASDWSGRQVAELVYPAGSQDPAEIVESSYAYIVLASLSPELYFHAPNGSETYRCEQLVEGTQVRLSEAACASQVTPRVTATTFGPMSDSGKTFAYIPLQTRDGEATGVSTFDGFYTQTTHDAVYGPDDYRIVETFTRTMQGAGFGFFAFPAVGMVFSATQTGATQQFYDPSLRVVERECSARSPSDVINGAVDDSVAACTAHEHDMSTGLALRTQKPQQRADDLGSSASELTAAFTSYQYVDPSQPESVHQIFVTKTIDPLGHEVVTRTDLGTGAALGRRGSNPGEESEVLIDGYGRPLEEWVSIDDAGTMRKVKHYSYDDGVLPQEVRVAQSRYLLSNDAPAQQYDDRYWQEVRTRYDGAGRPIEIVEWGIDADQPLQTVTHQYDERGNLVASSAPDPSQDSDAARVTHSFVHDSLDRRTCIVTPNGFGVVTTYGGHATLIREIAPDGQGGGSCETPATTASGPFAERRSQRDLFDRVIQLSEKTASGTADTTYGYDPQGHLASIHRHDAAAGDVLTTMTHDWLGRRLSVERKSPGASESSTWSYLYDLNGNLLVQTTPHPSGADPMLYSVSMVYDALDRVTSTQTYRAGLSVDAASQLAVGTTLMTYDTPGFSGIGRLRNVDLPFGSIDYRYDTRGNVVRDKRSVNLSGLGLGIELSDDVVTKFRRITSFGQPSRIVHPSGAKTRHRFGRLGNLPMAANATLVGGDTQDDTLHFSFRRNAAGLVTRLRSRVEVVHGPSASSYVGRKVLYSHDTMGRVLSAASDDPEGMRIVQTFEYTPSGEVKLHESQVGAAVDQRSFQYGYDQQHQLTHAFDDKGYSASFDFSASGRLLRATVAAPQTPGSLVHPRDVDYAYGAVDPEIVTQLTDHATSSSHALYAHDPAGQMVERSADGQSITFDYDSAGRLRRRAVAGGGDELYYYHDDARWLAVERNGTGKVTMVRLWVGDTEIHYSCPGGNCSRKKTRTDVRLGEQVVARLEDGAHGPREARVLHHDGLGHLLGVYSFNAAGPHLHYDLEAAFQYGPFGEILEASGSEAGDFTRRFNGKELDEESGLSYYGYRYYDPLSLTWNRGDPMYRFTPELAVDEPRRGNLYTFSLNNPVRYLDPDGRDPKKKETYAEKALDLTTKGLQEPADSTAGQLLQVWAIVQAGPFIGLAGLYGAAVDEVDSVTGGRADALLRFACGAICAIKKRRETPPIEPLENDPPSGPEPRLVSYKTQAFDERLPPKKKKKKEDRKPRKPKKKPDPPPPERTPAPPPTGDDVKPKPKHPGTEWPEPT